MRAAPRPGKCLAVAATPPMARPRAKPTPSCDTAARVRANVRPSCSIALPGRPMSRTGARSTLSPIEWRLCPVARPSRSAYAAPRAPITRAEGFGGPGSRLTRPPSWSTEISSGWVIDAGRRMAWSWEVSRRTDLRLPTFPSKRMTPPICPEEIIRRSAFGGWCPEKPVITRVPASWSSVRAGPVTASVTAARIAPNTRSTYRLDRNGLHDQKPAPGQGCRRRCRPLGLPGGPLCPRGSRIRAKRDLLPGDQGRPATAIRPQARRDGGDLRGDLRDRTDEAQRRGRGGRTARRDPDRALRGPRVRGRRRRPRRARLQPASQGRRGGHPGLQLGLAATRPLHFGAEGEARSDLCGAAARGRDLMAKPDLVVPTVAPEPRQNQPDEEPDDARDQQGDDQRRLRLADDEVDGHLLKVDGDEDEAERDQDDREPEPCSATFLTGPLHPAR